MDANATGTRDHRVSFTPYILPWTVFGVLLGAGIVVNSGISLAGPIPSTGLLLGHTVLVLLGLALMVIAVWIARPHGVTVDEHGFSWWWGRDSWGLPWSDIDGIVLQGYARRTHPSRPRVLNRNLAIGVFPHQPPNLARTHPRLRRMWLPWRFQEGGHGYVLMDAPCSKRLMRRIHALVKTHAPARVGMRVRER